MITNAQLMHTLPSKLLVLAGFLLLLNACKNDKLVQRGDSLEVAYSKAMAFYEAEDYTEAATAFETVTRSGRGTEYAQDAQYYLAESYFNAERFLLAASEYDRFASYYPQDERRQEVEYKSALSFYYQSPRYRLDQSATRTAIERFQLFINRYPDSEYVQNASDRIDELRSKLAHKSYSAAQFYLRTQQYEAATIYLDLVIDQYPESVWAERALVQLVDTFIEYADNSIPARQAERYQKAVDNYEKFLQLFPQSELRGEIENYHDEAARKLAEVSPVTEAENSGSESE